MNNSVASWAVLAAGLMMCGVCSASVTVEQAVAPTLRHVDLVATGGPDDAGALLQVSRGGEPLGTIRLTATASGSRGSIRVGLPLAVDAQTPPTVVRLGDAMLATIAVPDTEDRRRAAFMEVPFKSHSMFAGAALPKPAFEQAGWVETLFGPHTLTARYFNNAHEEVSEAAEPGRYGMVVRLDAEGIEPIYRYLTIYRVPGGLDWGGYAVALTVPESVGVDPRVLAAAHDQLDDMARWELVDRFEHGPHGAAFFGAMRAASIEDAPFTGADAYWNADEAWWIALKKKIGLFEHRYLTYLPAGYEENSDKTWPLVIYLHGPESTGTDLDRVKQHALPKLMEGGKQLPAIVVAPQLEAERWWVPAVVADLADELASKYRVDRDRIYLTGIAMGGFSSWYTAGFYPEKFAAIVPIRAGGDLSLAADLKNVPAWGFHAADDPGVPIARHQKMVDAVNAAGGHARLTAVEGDDPAVWDSVYQRDDLWGWLFAQRRGR